MVKWKGWSGSEENSKNEIEEKDQRKIGENENRVDSLWKSRKDLDGVWENQNQQEWSEDEGAKNDGKYLVNKEMEHEEMKNKKLMVKN